MSFGTFLLSIIPGGVSCFFGLKLQKIVFAFMWFLLGFVVIQGIFNAFHIESILVGIFSVIVGLILALCSLRLQEMAFFILLFLGGYLSIYFFTSHIWYNSVLGILVGIGLGVLGVKFFEPMLIISTSVSGGFSIMQAIVQFFDLKPIAYSIIIFLVFAFLGMWYQYTCFQKQNKNKVVRKKKAI